MRITYVLFLALIVVVLVGFSFSPLGFLRLQNGVVGTRVTEHGLVQEIISDCPPRQNQTCTGFDIFVLRTIEGKTYLLTNFPKDVGNEWKNRTVSVTGYLSSSASGFSFVDGDLYVESVIPN